MSMSIFTLFSTSHNPHSNSPYFFDFYLLIHKKSRS